jgi:hypothetical protein
VWPVNEDKTPVKTEWHATPAYRARGGGNAGCNVSKNVTNCFEAPAVRHRPMIANKIAIFHYITRSREDFEAKLERGSGVPGFARDETWFQSIEKCALDFPLHISRACLFQCSRVLDCFRTCIEVAAGCAGIRPTLQSVASRQSSPTSAVRIFMRGCLH